MLTKREQLEEGWIKFVRYYCKEGYLDKWMGDSIDNPNNSSKNQMSLNSNITYWRCNNSKWLSDYEIGRGEVSGMLEISDSFTAEEIWNEILKNK